MKNLMNENISDIMNGVAMPKWKYSIRRVSEFGLLYFTLLLFCLVI